MYTPTIVDLIPSYNHIISSCDCTYLEHTHISVYRVKSNVIIKKNHLSNGVLNCQFLYVLLYILYEMKISPYPSSDCHFPSQKCKEIITLIRFSLLHHFIDKCRKAVRIINVAYEYMHVER